MGGVDINILEKLQALSNERSSKLMGKLEFDGNSPLELILNSQNCHTLRTGGDD